MKSIAPILKMAIPAAFTRAEVVSLKDHPGYDEAWLEREIAKDPKILGLGDLQVVRAQLRQDKERRLDLLLKDAEEDTYYSVELMLGELNASHLIRGIDYWLRNEQAFEDKEWDHVPVVVAEKISEGGCRRVARWLSEVSPLVLIELRAIQVSGNLAVQTFKVFDGRDVQEELDLTRTQPVGREYWVKKSSERSLALAEKLVALLLQIDAGLQLSYRQEFLGITARNRPANFVVFHPKRNFVRVRAKLTETDEWANKLKQCGIEPLRIKAGRSLHFKIHDALTQTQLRIVKELFERAYEERFPDPD
jgi:hypothetical protein